MASSVTPTWLKQKPRVTPRSFSFSRGASQRGLVPKTVMSRPLRSSSLSTKSGRTALVDGSSGDEASKQHSSRSLKSATTAVIAAPKRILRRASTFVDHQRQRRVVRRASSFVCDHSNRHCWMLDDRDLPSHFFAEEDCLPGDSGHSNDSENYLMEVAAFHRQELVLGELLGEGQFSQVSELLRIDLQDESDASVASVATASTELSQYEQNPRHFHRRRLQYQQCCDGASSSDQDKNDVTTSTVEVSEESNTTYLSQHSLRFPSSQTSPYAVKHLRKELLRDPKLFSNAAYDLVSEAKLMAKLNHPNIVKLRGVAATAPTNSSDYDKRSSPSAIFGGERFDSFFLVMDRMNVTLSHRIHRQWARASCLDPLHSKPSLQLKLEYALQLASALAYLHKKRIVYRDVKPDNAGFFGPSDGHQDQDRLQLFDLGMCRCLPLSSVKDDREKAMEPDNDNSVYRMSIAGTMRYMAVELLLRQPYGLKADVYSFAMTVYEMIAEKRPFKALPHTSFNEVVASSGVRPSLSFFNLPVSVGTLIHEAWHQDATRRPSMSDVCRRLTGILDGLKSKAEEASVECNSQAAQ